MSISQPTYRSVPASKPVTMIKPVWKRDPNRDEHLPPEEFDHAFPGALHIYRGDRDWVQMQCRVKRHTLLGCADPSKDGTFCNIFIVNDDVLQPYLDYMKIDYSIVLRHEIGHCLGWVHPTPVQRGR